MSYVREESMIIYNSKDGKNIRQFDSTDFIASLASYIPNMGEQMVRYLGFYSNVCRGRRKRQNCDRSDFIITDDEYRRGCNKSWARLIKKIYEVDLLTYPKCGRQMRIIANLLKNRLKIALTKLFRPSAYCLLTFPRFFIFKA